MTLILDNNTFRVDLKTLREIRTVQTVDPPYKDFTSFLNDKGQIEDVQVVEFYDKNNNLVATSDWVRGWRVIGEQRSQNDWDKNECIPECTFDGPIAELILLLLLRDREDKKLGPVYITDKDLKFATQSDPPMRSWKGEQNYGVRSHRVKGGYAIWFEAMEQK